MEVAHPRVSLGREVVASVRSTCEHVFVSYAELHAHSAFSFLDGASLPDELAGAAAELGYEAMALTDHNSVSGSMEFAQAAGALGLRAIHWAEIDLDDGRHITLLVEDATGWRNLCRILTRAYVHTREKHEPPPSVPLETVEEHATGLVCLSGCARQGVRDEPTMRRLQDAFVALRQHTTLDASEPVRRGNFAHVLASPKAMAARFEDHPEAVRETLALAARLRFDLGSDLGYRYPGSDDADAGRKLAELF